MAYQPGPFDQAHIYVQWGGKLPGGEQWSCGLRMAGTPATAVADAATLVDDYATAIEAFHTSNLVNISSLAKLSSVKVNAIGTDGLYIAQTTNEIVLADVGGAATGTFVHPNQIALAVSLTTGFSRGPAHRGRFYVPIPSSTPGTDGLLVAAYATGVGTAVDTLIAALNAATPAWKVNVFSRKLGAPAHRPVTGNEVGRVLDTQRRRRRSLIEDYR